MRIILISIFLISTFTHSVALAESPHNYVPPKGIVPDSATAIKIAEAIWLPIYGEQVLSKKPYKAELQGNVWIVTGTLSGNTVGGVPIVEISKTDGKVIRLSHGK